MSISRKVSLGVATVGLVALSWLAFGIMGASLVACAYVAGKPVDAWWMELVVVLGVIATLLIVLSVVKWPRWSTLGCVAVVPILLFSFLGYDRAPLPTPNLGERAGEDDAVYRIVLWMTASPRSSRLVEVPIPQDHELLSLPADGSDWRASIVAHRASIEKNWNEQTVGKEWLFELSRQNGSRVWPAELDSPLMRLPAVRAAVYAELLHALVLAYDGDPDAGLIEVARVIEANQTLQRCGPCLVNQMIATVIEKSALRAAAAIVHDTQPSAASRLRLRELLERAPGMALLFRNACEGELELGVSSMRTARGSGKRIDEGPRKGRRVDQAIRFLGPFVLNYNQTVADLGSTLRKIEASSNARRLDEKSQIQLPPITGLNRLKNPAGPLLNIMFLPAYGKPISLMWAAEDARASLVRELGQVAAANGAP